MPLLKNLLAVVQDLFGRGRPRRSSSRRKTAARKRKPAVRKKIAKPRRLIRKSVKPKVRKKAPRKTVLKSPVKKSGRLSGTPSLLLPLPTNVSPVKAVAATKAKGSRKSPPASEQVGVITHYFPKIMVCVVRVTQGELRRGGLIHIRGGSSDFTQSVQSLQVESVDVAVARKGQLVGMKVIQPVQPGDAVERLPPR